MTPKRSIHELRHRRAKLALAYGVGNLFEILQLADWDLAKVPMLGERALPRENLQAFADNIDRALCVTPEEKEKLNK